MVTALNTATTGFTDSDVLVGGTGSETMAGGTVGDTTTDIFKWALGDQGTTATPAADVIKDFNIAPVASGGDVLDLKDLLVGEHSGSSANLTQYLHFETADGKATLSVDHDGGSSTFAADQTIKFDNYADVNALATALGAASSSDADIIAKMITNGNLKTDI